MNPRCKGTLFALLVVTAWWGATEACGGNAVNHGAPAAAEGLAGSGPAAGASAVAVNVVWVLVAGFLVMFMQAGFGMIGTGLCRAKNAAHTISMSLMVYPLVGLAFWAYGFALGWGNWSSAPVGPGWTKALGPGLATLNSGLGFGPGSPATTAPPGDKSPAPEPTAAANGPSDSGAFAYGLLGTKGFFLSGMDDAGVLALFFLMMVLMVTAATIPTGAMAERWAWKNFCLYGLWVGLPLCLMANWVWGGGFLAQAGRNWGLGHGAVDFAGSGVVHAMGGIIGLAGTFVLGPRIGKYRNGRPVPIPGHQLPLVVIGTLVLAFGWFGFNPGATLAGTDLRISSVAVNTALASMAGAVAAMVTLHAKRIKPDPTMMCNGMLAGLVAISASCAFVDSWAAVLIGAVAGVLVVLGVVFWEVRRIDDPVGAVSTHGMSGIWGVLALGLFANGKYGAGWNGVARGDWVGRAGSDGVRGLFYGDPGQLLAQLIYAAVVAAFGFLVAYVWFRISNRITPLRVSGDAEMEGLDVPEMGAEGYPDFTIAKRW